MAKERVTINGTEYVVKDVHRPWLHRKELAVKDRAQYMPQVKVNRMFSAGKQQLNVNTRDGRVVEVRTRNGVELLQSNILDQYLNTAVGTLSSTDYKSNFLSVQMDAMAEDLTKTLNQGFSWGWEHEWGGDAKVLALYRTLSIDGTCAVRVRYDRRFGEIVGDVPYKDGQPILDNKEAAKYVAEQASNGQTAKIQTLREGKVVWELLKIENLLPPPGVEDPADFPWEIICRPVSVAEVKNRYGSLADDVGEEDIESPASLTSSYTDTQVKLDGMTMVYTGYERANNEHKKGRVVVFTEDALLDVREQLDYHDHPQGPRTGIHYFRWTVIPGRFIGKAFIENGIGPQKTYNKRLTQVNAIIDRNMPKVFIEEQSLSRPRTGEPMEIIEVRPGAPLPKVEQGIPPGAWMLDDLRLSVENAERAMGLRGVTMGQAPAGVSAYSAMALLTENDSKKLDPVARGFRLELNEVSWDTMEAMRNWPSSKIMLIAGPNDTVAAVTFNSSKIPATYLCRAPREGGIPNSQAAEIQKVNDIWNAAGGKLPLPWYIASLNAGRAQELPPSLGDADIHKAELENVIMQQSGEAPPVAPYDDDELHVRTHRAQQSQLQNLADQGHSEYAQTVQVFEEHIKEHEASAAAQAAPQGLPPSGGMPPAPPVAGGAPSPGMTTPGQGQAAPGPSALPPGVLG